MRKIERNEASIKFAEWAYNCPHGIYGQKRREIMTELNQNTAQYSNMLRGKTRIHHLAIPIIERIIGQKLTDTKHQK